MIYEYKCRDCEAVHEVWAKISDPPPAACPVCQSSHLERVISATTFALKGSGWYTTDYKKPASSSTGSSMGSSSSSGSGDGGSGSTA